MNGGAPTACPLCGRGTEAARGLYACRACGLAFRSEKVSLLHSYEPACAAAIFVTAKAALFAGALDFLDASLPARGRLLDIGCADGELMLAAAARGWKAEGVELHPALAAAARSRGFRVLEKPVEAAGLEAGAYAAVTVFEVFCLMRDPVTAAAELARLLRPGGVVYLRDYNASFQLPLEALQETRLLRALGLRPAVIHNFNFRPGALRLLLARAGFRDITIRNSRPTSGDPYRTGGRLGGFFTGAVKVLYYYLAQALWLLSCGRVYAGSSLIVTARK